MSKQQLCTISETSLSELSVESRVMPCSLTIAADDAGTKVTASSGAIGQSVTQTLAGAKNNCLSLGRVEEKSILHKPSGNI